VAQGEPFEPVGVEMRSGSGNEFMACVSHVDSVNIMSRQCLHIMFTRETTRYSPTEPVMRLSRSGSGVRPVERLGSSVGVRQGLAPATKVDTM